MAKKDLVVEEEGDAKGGSRKMLILIGAAVLSLAAGAGGVYFFMSSKLGELEAKVEQANMALAQEMAPRMEQKGEPRYLEFDPDFTLNISGSQQEHFLTVGLSVLTYEQDTFDMLNHYRPVLRNSLVIMMGDAVYESLLSPEGKERLRDAVKDKIIEVMLDNDQEVDVSEVYFTKFLMQ